jgi:hypothetical protein
MPDSQQSRPLTAEEQFRMLFDRTAKLNDKVSALLAPAWGSEMGIIPTGHPLYQGEKSPAAQQEEQGAPVDWQAIARQRERELKTEGVRKHLAQQERDGAYRERAHLVALLAAMTGDAVIAPALDVPEPGWWIVYLTIGGHQASWHISPRDAHLFNHVPRADANDPRVRWDGHTTEEKYERIAAHTAELAKGR